MKITKHICDICGIEIKHSNGIYPANIDFENPNGKYLGDYGFVNIYKQDYLDICNQCMHKILNYISSIHTNQKTSLKIDYNIKDNQIHRADCIKEENDCLGCKLAHAVELLDLACNELRNNPQRDSTDCERIEYINNLRKEFFQQIKEGTENG